MAIFIIQINMLSWKIVTSMKIRRIIINIMIMIINLIIGHMIFTRGEMLLLISIACLGSVLIDVVNAQTLDICCPMKEVMMV